MLDTAYPYNTLDRGALARRATPGEPPASTTCRATSFDLPEQAKALGELLAYHRI
ncbi:hypothetical protein GCM10010166_65090 [Couchioplanes caeruleus subsp. azureus]|nr:hypothetical protein GCM10010166_65090 [Couchioplanes caeruleus subsp. azureus]